MLGVRPPRGIREIRRALLIEADALDGVGNTLEGVVGRLRLLRVVQIDRRKVEPDTDEPIGISIWQRPEQHAVDDGKYRDGGTDADHERERGGDREDRRAPEGAPRVTEGLGEWHGGQYGSLMREFPSEGRDGKQRDYRKRD